MKGIYYFGEFNMKIDLFIPIGPKDYKIAQESIDNKRLKIKDLGNIYFYTDDPSVQYSGAIKIEDSKFIRTLRSRVYDCPNIDSKRAGWYFQQLLTIYFHKIINSSNNNIIFCCCDVFFVKEQVFYVDGLPVVTLGSSSVHEPFWDIGRILFKDNYQNNGYSGIAHYFPFRIDYLKDMHNRIENIHNCDLLKVLLSNLSLSERSGFSEYETFFLYLLTFEDHFYIRDNCCVDVDNHNARRFRSIEYIAAHWYMHKEKMHTKTLCKLFLNNIINYLFPPRIIKFEHRYLSASLFQLAKRRRLYWVFSMIYYRLKQRNL